MKKLESFLRKYSWQLMLGIVLLFLFWAVKFHLIFYPAITELKNDWKISRNRGADFVRERDTYRLLEQMEKEAVTKGSLYGPREYFADLERIHEFTEGYQVIRFACDPMKLQRLMLDNMDKGFYTMKDLEEARSRLEKKDREKEAIKNRFVISSFPTFAEFKMWAIMLYLKGMFLSLLWYLIVMSGRRGILQTVLAGKFTLLRALVLWPKYWLKYPGDSIREIVVEAELRRLGRPFRKLTEAEQKIVRRIAASAGYREWTIDFRRENSNRFERSFRSALVITLFMVVFIPTLFSPVRSEATSKARAGPVTVMHQDAHQHSNISGGFQESFALAEGFAPDLCQEQNTFYDFAETLVEKVFAEDIEHVPIIRLFGSGYSYQPTR